MGRLSGGGRLLGTPEINIQSLTEKTIPANADLVLIEDSEASYVKKKVLFSALKSSAGLGDVDGPASATDNALVRFDAATGKLIQNSGVTLNDLNSMTIPATKTSIHTFTSANWNEDGATWTMAAGGPLVHVTGNTTTVTATNSEAIVVGTTYKVTITGTGGVATATYTLGGVTGTTLASSGAIAITDYITANTTASLIITPVSGCTVSITSITIEKLTDATGDLTVEGDLFVRSHLSVIGITSSASAPAIQIGVSNTGFNGTNVRLSSIVNGVSVHSWTATSYDLASDTGVIRIGTASDTILARLAANSLAIRNGTAAQTFTWFETYTDASNYESYSIDAGVTTGDTLTIKGNTAGTGADNLSIALVPVGTGTLVIGNPINVAAAGVGTLTNAPVAGNPAGFVKMKIGAVDYGIPYWALV